MLYVISMIVLLVFYVLGIIYLNRLKNTKLLNYIFPTVIFLCYISVVIRTFLVDGINDWNFRNTLPVANVSPFMFTLVAFIHLFPTKVKKHLYLLISLLSVGMLFSFVLGSLRNAIINYKFHLHFLLDYLAHVMLSLWGVYFIKTNQVKLTKRNVIISSSIIIGVAVIMLILNVIFDTAFFGLSLYGKHSIYNNVLTSNSYLSTAIYFIGLIIILALGYAYSYLLKRKTLIK